MSNYRRIFIPNSIIFITINTYGKKDILVDNINLLRRSIKDSLYKFKIIAGVVLPNHIHILIQPENVNELPKIIFSIKYRFSRYFGGVGTPPYNLSDSKIKKGEKGIWQRRYYDHVIRDENDLYKHIDYIHYNPVKHGYTLKAKDWKFSSFEKFVKEGYYNMDWCNFEDKYRINDLNYE